MKLRKHVSGLINLVAVVVVVLAGIWAWYHAEQLGRVKSDLQTSVNSNLSLKTQNDNLEKLSKKNLRLLDQYKDGVAEAHEKTKIAQAAIRGIT